MSRRKPEVLRLPFDTLIGQDDHERMKTAFRMYLWSTREEFKRADVGGNLNFDPLEYRIFKLSWEESNRWRQPVHPVPPKREYTVPPWMTGQRTIYEHEVPEDGEPWTYEELDEMSWPRSWASN